ncbi:LOW QUALITY PROTEIN: guanylate-binding protein 6-like [Talpa occidentalis]|uniref:LOW QUALITY PROTEIN: guanylate-binding protein 6-like n=1 Tax=Talpa occidentalis TaxID=50954 RepID=UPI00188FF931|nr:LOW QUALITY PROTEIN: guanylate-binding protein 6-like [Talpa occidentalis]
MCRLISTLTVLLSICLVHKKESTINKDALEKLYYVTKLTELIRSKSSSSAEDLGDSTECLHFFPDFIWTVWDFTLELKNGDRNISADEYLDNALKLTAELETLVVTYVDAIKSGKIPCVEYAVTTLAQLENSAAMDKAAEHNSQQMAQRVSFPTESLQELLDVHAACEREAMAIFMEHSFKDNKREYQVRLMKIIKKKKEDFLRQNEEVSGKYCQELLEKLSEDLTESISAGTFHAPGGHKLYREAMDRIERDYLRGSGKGVKAKEVFQSTLQSQAAVEKSILQADRALSDGLKAIAEEMARKEVAEKEQKFIIQRLEEQQQQMEAQMRSLQENLGQPQEKMSCGRANLLREENIMLKHKLKIQEAMFKQGFQNKCAEMGAEINRLKEEIATKDDHQNDDLWIAKTLDKFGNAIASVLSAAGKLIGNLVKGMGALFKTK